MAVLVPVACEPLEGAGRAGLGRALDVLVQRAHVVNRRLRVAVLWRLPAAAEGEEVPQDVAAALLSQLQVPSAAAVAGCPAVVALCGEVTEERAVFVRRLVPRQAGAATELDLVIRDGLSAWFLPLQDESRLVPPFPFRVYVDGDCVHVAAPLSAAAAPSAGWLRTQLLPRVARWAADMAAEEGPARTEGSLNLVDPERYHCLYTELKEKYGAQFVKIWPEKTDPLKFVHEDVAIASYLLLLWEEGRRKIGTEKRQSFVDIGCGNGLLVHILCSEGHPGYGVDISSRNIWKLYPSTTRLEVSTITPSSETTYPGCEWLIGNHSDELTPWIPVMAAASGPDTRFFLLPCCPWDFYSKYQRTNTRVSQYEEYLGYVSELAARCGYLPEGDRLRIPSTRRRCIVGRLRERAVSAAELRELTAAGRGGGGGQFRPRAAVQPVRNCTQLERGVAQEAVRTVALRLAAAPEDQGEAELTLREAAQLLGAAALGRLRQQCGGLKTLLRNHRHVFEVRGDTVRLQSAGWLRADSARPDLAAALKTSLCWQHQHLPAGCPLPAPLCRYAHGEHDLRPPPDLRHGRRTGRT